MHLATTPGWKRKDTISCCRPTRMLATAWMLGTLGTVLGFFATGLHAQENPAPQPSESASRVSVATGGSIGFIGLHGGIYEQLQPLGMPLDVRLTYFDDVSISNRTADLSAVDVLMIQHTREEDREAYVELITSAKQKKPGLVILLLQQNTLDLMRGLKLETLVAHDPQATKYYGSSQENLRRLLVYVLAKYLRRDIAIEPPQEVDREGFYHPESKTLFKSSDEFLLWLRKEKQVRSDQPRILVAVHSTHLFFQQPRVVDAIVRELEKQGAIAVAVIDGRSKLYEVEAKAFAPSAVIHTCHSMDNLDLRMGLDVPHLHSIFIRKQSIDEWQMSVDGLSSSELAFHVIGQELLGAIEPQVGAGLRSSQSDSDALLPIPDRIAHLAARTLAYARLRSLPNADKKIAILYYDREMGKGELMRGSATGMHMNGPRSLLNVLSRMRQSGYDISPLPRHEDQLLGWMMERGRLIGVWAPSELDRLARFGTPALIPAEEYRAWYEAKIPADRREQTEAKWGPPPGRFMVWKSVDKEYLVVPRIDLGNTILLPQPLRGELHGKETANSQVHDQASTPPHNYLATYFWLQEGFKADAMIHFGTHGSEFALPGKPNGLSQRDWPDIILGAIPNFNPWIIENMVESSPVRRRAYGTLISHLPPPIIHVGLSDELANVSETIDKWEALEEGGLKQKFLAEIAKQVRSSRLDKDLGIDLTADAAQLDESQVKRIKDYLLSIREESIPTTLHVFGVPPSEALLPPYMATILRKPFQMALAQLLNIQDEEQAREACVRVARSMMRDGLDGKDAVALELGKSIDELPEPIERGLQLVRRLQEGFAKTTDEVDNLLRGLEGRFVPPGPGNSPIRNPNAVPTGRNMYLLNPEEIPTRPSWELGKTLAEQLIERHREQHGEYPTKVGFDLRSSATFRDYGVMEGQILTLLGVEPIWDERMLVNDVRLIPREELGRPRVDVFIAAGSWYESNLPTRLNLWDKAVRLVAQAHEDDNPIAKNSVMLAESLASKGLSQERIDVLKTGRIFGRAPGRESGGFLGYSVARSGDWNDRRDIAEEYLAEVKHVYTAGAWGEEAAPLYDQAIQGTHTVVRSWSDHMTGPLSSKYTWLHGGSLSLAVEFMTGKRPEYLFSDVRDPDNAKMMTSEDAVRREFRSRLSNRAWLEGMQKEGYAGADHIRVMVSNSFGWETMRPGSIGDDQWNEMKQIIVDDKLRLQLREWFEKNNPYAYQDTTATMIEAIRKDFWKADAETLRQLTEEYAASVVEHGTSGHITSGGNAMLEQLVKESLEGSGKKELVELAMAFSKAMENTRTVESISNELLTPAPVPSPSIPIVETTAAMDQGKTVAPSASESVPPSRAEVEQTSSRANEATVRKQDTVTGTRLEPMEQEAVSISRPMLYLVFIAVILFTVGFLTRRGY